MIQSKQAPFDWSNYQRTGNNAIDIVAQCVGYNRKARKPLKTIILKPTYYSLFKAGLEILMKERIEDVATEMTFDGVKIERGSQSQWDNVICEYYKPALN